MKLTIIHNENSQTFEGSLEDKPFSLSYEISPTGEMILVHTYVHPDLRGQGVASSLLEEVSQWARNHNKKVIPLCSYTVVFYRRHKEYQDILSDDYDKDSDGVCSLPKK
jgi:hypothetical protein